MNYDYQTTSDLHVEGIASDEGKEEYELPLKDPSNSIIISTQQSDVFLNKQISALPSFAKHNNFQWRNINVYVGKNKNKKQILHDFNGFIESGELLAVMGGSGAGKSTLLNVLSGRTNLNQQKVNGYLVINEQTLKCSDQKTIKSLCCYVPQSDILCPTQTVEEALLFYAKLKLSHYTKHRQQKRINYLMKVLDLNKCRNNLIGSESKRGISGGERRRVSIASEILNDSDIVFLDEPTSGLDAYTASKTIKTLKQFCSVSNKIIIATIHQPSMEVFYLFDKLMLISNGKCCFNSYINDIDIFFKHSLKPRANPADIIVFEVQRNSNKYVTKWEESALNTVTNNKQIDYEWTKYDKFILNDYENNIKINGKMACKKLQYQLLLKRECKSLIRDKRVSIVQIIQVLFFGFAAGLTYFNISQSFQERVRCFFLLCIMPLLFGIVSLLTIYPKQKLLFQREYNSKTYNITSWAFSLQIIEIPQQIINMFIFTLITYFMVNLDGNFIKYWFTFFLTAFSGGSFGIFFGTICKSTVEAAQTVPAALIPLLIFSDGLVGLQSLPTILQYIATINPLYYLIRCFYIIEFFGVSYPRHLSDDEQKLCDAYYQLTNATSHRFDAAVNAKVAKLNCSIVDEVDTEMDLDGYMDYDNYNEFPLSTTDLTSQIEDVSYNATVFAAEDKEKVDTFCSDEISYKYFFDYKDLDKNALIRYWITIIMICFVLRLISIFILLIINNNGFSWFCNKINISFKRKNKVSENELDDIEINDLKNKENNDEIFAI